MIEILVLGKKFGFGVWWKMNEGFEEWSFKIGIYLCLMLNRLIDTLLS